MKNKKITLTIFFLILLLPTSNSTILNGLPFDSLPELFFILVSTLLLNYILSKSKKKKNYSFSHYFSDY